MSKRNRRQSHYRGASASRRNQNEVTNQNQETSRRTENRSDGTNRQHKDRLFKSLFGSPERKELTLELYNAMNGSSYTDPDEIELTTIDDVVYMGMKNDVSFLFDQTMHLWEQQSTRNPNMPLRFLLYYAHVLERYVHELPAEAGNINSSALVRLPAPEPVLFYNGPGVLPGYLHLSDAYEHGTRLCVELHVRVININSGQDRILELCQPLKDYTTFVETFRGYREMGNVSNRAAANKAIAELPAGAVKEYLGAHEAEVIDMLLTEYDEEKTLKAEYYVGMRAGVQEEQERALRRLMEKASKGRISISLAVELAADYGIIDEEGFRKRATEMGIQLPD